MGVAPGFAGKFEPTPLIGGAWSENPRVAPVGRVRVNTPSLAFAADACIVVRRDIELCGWDCRLYAIDDGVLGAGRKEGVVGRDFEGVGIPPPPLENRGAGCLNIGIGGGDVGESFIGLMARLRNDEGGGARIGVVSWLTVLCSGSARGFLVGGVSSITNTHPGEPRDVGAGCAGCTLCA
jgi:hypothetical protein